MLWFLAKVESEVAKKRQRIKMNNYLYLPGIGNQGHYLCSNESKQKGNEQRKICRDFCCLLALSDDIAASLHRKGVRIVTLEDSVGIEIANETCYCVELRDILEDRAFRESVERLIGNGDMLLAVGYEMERLQGAYVSSDEVGRIVDANCE